MKQIVKKSETVIPKIEVGDSNLNKNTILGLVSKQGKKSFVTRSDYDKGSFQVLCAYDFANGNGYSFLDNFSDKTDLVKEALNLKFEVFVFDSEKELFKWLSED